MFDDIASYIRSIFDTDGFIPLHEPKFFGNEKRYLNECIDTGFVSSHGEFVNLLEDKVAKYTGAKMAVAVVNGTSALHASLVVSGVCSSDEVIVSPLTFVATCNAISYTGAKPVFIDVDLDTMGMSPVSLQKFLMNNCDIVDNRCINRITRKRIKACIPVHLFGTPCRVDELLELCNEWNITLIEDASQALGSYYKGVHAGTFGKLGVFSFNGNKIVTAGGGGCIITDDEELAKTVKHITTTAKVPHRWEYNHDMTGYNYRMPNINAALLLAQLEQLDRFVKSKRELALLYEHFFSGVDGIDFVKERENSRSNYWLQTILMKSSHDRDQFLDFTNSCNIMTRPLWRLMNELEMFKDCCCEELENSRYLEQRVVNIPSSVRVSS